MSDKAYTVLYTHQKSKKAKTWHDGVLRLPAAGHRASLFDDENCRLDSVYVRCREISVGEELESDKYLIQVEEALPEKGGAARASPEKRRQSEAEVPGCGSSVTSSCGGTVRGLGASVKRKKKGFVPPRQVKPKIDSADSEPVVTPSDRVPPLHGSDPSFSSFCNPSLSTFASLYSNSQNASSSCQPSPWSVIGQSKSRADLTKNTGPISLHNADFSKKSHAPLESEAARQSECGIPVETSAGSLSKRSTSQILALIGQPPKYGLQLPVAEIHDVTPQSKAKRYPSLAQATRIQSPDRLPSLAQATRIQSPDRYPAGPVIQTTSSVQIQRPQQTSSGLEDSSQDANTADTAQVWPQGQSSGSRGAASAAEGSLHKPEATVSWGQRISTDIRDGDRVGECSIDAVLADANRFDSSPGGGASTRLDNFPSGGASTRFDHSPGGGASTRIDSSPGRGASNRFDSSPRGGASTRFDSFPDRCAGNRIGNSSAYARRESLSMPRDNGDRKGPDDDVIGGDFNESACFDIDFSPLSSASLSEAEDAVTMKMKVGETEKETNVLEKEETEKMTTHCDTVTTTANDVTYDEDKPLVEISQSRGFTAHADWRRQATKVSLSINDLNTEPSVNANAGDKEIEIRKDGMKETELKREGTKNRREECGGGCVSDDFCDIPSGCFDSDFTQDSQSSAGFSHRAQSARDAKMARDDAELWSRNGEKSGVLETGTCLIGEVDDKDSAMIRAVPDHTDNAQADNDGKFPEVKSESQGTDSMEPKQGLFRVADLEFSEESQPRHMYSRDVLGVRILGGSSPNGKYTATSFLAADSPKAGNTLVRELSCWSNEPKTPDVTSVTLRGHTTDPDSPPVTSPQQLARQCHKAETGAITSETPLDVEHPKNHDGRNERPLMCWEQNKNGGPFKDGRPVGHFEFPSGSVANERHGWKQGSADCDVDALGPMGRQGEWGEAGRFYGDADLSRVDSGMCRSEDSDRFNVTGNSSHIGRIPNRLARLPNPSELAAEHPPRPRRCVTEDPEKEKENILILINEKLGNHAVAGSKTGSVVRRCRGDVTTDPWCSDGRAEVSRHYDRQCPQTPELEVSDEPGSFYHFSSDELKQESRFQQSSDFIVSAKDFFSKRSAGEGNGEVPVWMQTCPEDTSLTLTPVSSHGDLGSAVRSRADTISYLSSGLDSDSPEYAECPAEPSRTQHGGEGQVGQKGQGRLFRGSYNVENRTEYARGSIYRGNMEMTGCVESVGKNDARSVLTRMENKWRGGGVETADPEALPVTFRDTPLAANQDPFSRSRTDLKCGSKWDKFEPEGTLQLSLKPERCSPDYRGVPSRQYPRGEATSGKGVDHLVPASPVNQPSGKREESQATNQSSGCAVLFSSPAPVLSEPISDGFQADRRNVTSDDFMPSGATHKYCPLLSVIGRNAMQSDRPYSALACESRNLSGDLARSLTSSQTSSKSARGFQPPRVVGGRGNGAPRALRGARRGFRPPVLNLQSGATRASSQRSLCAELYFPGKEEAESNVTPSRDVSVPVTFANAAAYRRVFTALLTEHLNIQLFDLSKAYHGALSQVDVTSYKAAGKVVSGKALPCQRSTESANPPCEHGRPARIQQVKKDGPNKGRFFFACNGGRNDKCRFFKWADDSSKTGSSAKWGCAKTRLELADADSICTYVKGQGVALYCGCTFLKKVPDHYSARSKRMQARRMRDEEAAPEKKIYIRLSRREASAQYSKDDLWVVSGSLDFAHGHTFLARSVFFGPTANNELEVLPVSTFSPSNWHSESCCHAIRAGNCSNELICLENLNAFVQPTTLPIMPYLLARSQATPPHQAFFGDWSTIKDEVDQLISRFDLNEFQSEALWRIADMFNGDVESERPPITLIHGVFGAGKSFLLAVVIQLLVKLFEMKDLQGGTATGPTKLLLSSTTNVAVDRVLLGLLRAGYDRFVRVGSVRKIAKPVLPYSVHAAGSDSHELRELQDMLKSDLLPSEKAHVRKSIERLKNGANKRRLEQVRVVGATCAACPFKCLAGLRFHVVILDECSQITEPASLLPIARFGCEKLILVGDPKQLDPTIQGSEAAHGRGLEQTLFDRLTKMGYEPVMLRTQYRCHPRISAIANQLFYDNQLIDGITAEDRPPLASTWPTLCFLDVTGGREESGGGGSAMNEEEAAVVVLLLRALLAEGVAGSDVGVITLYRAQQTAIAARLAACSVAEPAELRAIQVSTVDAFQGGEKGVIILSCVKTDSTAFMDNDKRINVALTRSRNHLFIVGNRRNLVRNEMWSKVLQHCQAAPNGIKSADDFRKMCERKFEAMRDQEEGQKSYKRKRTGSLHKTPHYYNETSPEKTAPHSREGSKSPDLESKQSPRDPPDAEPCTPSEGGSGHPNNPRGVKPKDGGKCRVLDADVCEESSEPKRDGKCRVLEPKDGGKCRVLDPDVCTDALDGSESDEELPTYL